MILAICVGSRFIGLKHPVIADAGNEVVCQASVLGRGHDEQTFARLGNSPHAFPR